MFTIASIVVSQADGSLPTTVTIDEAAGNLVLGGPVIPVSVLDDFVDACRQLLDQPRDDGETTTSIQVTGGPLVSFVLGATPAEDAVKPHASLAAAWRRDKIDGGLLAALEALGAAGLL